MNRAKERQMRQHEQGNEKAKPRVNLRFMLMCAMILAVAGGIVGLSMSLPEKTRVSRGATSRPSLPANFPSLAKTSTIQNPRPYQYDPVTNQHWVPGAGHDHWHQGQPPANTGGTTPGTTTVIDSGSFSTTPNLAIPNLATPNITNPTPWQYDPATNKHWDPRPGHVHWHTGPAPPESDR